MTLRYICCLFAASFLLGAPLPLSLAASGDALALEADARAAPKKKKGKDDGKKDADPAKSKKKARDLGTLEAGEAGYPSYYIMPDILVNLASQERRPYFLKLSLTLEAEKAEAFGGVPRLMPRLIDQLQLFLRELHIDDLNGTAGGYRLRLELLRRINLAMAPQKIDAVLIEEMLIQ